MNRIICARLLFHVATIITVQIIEHTEEGFACVSNPCAHGICIDDLNSSYTCYCVDGYTGLQCQTNWDECWSSPCLNGGSCIDGIASYSCSCLEGFTGINCEEDINECLSNPCINNGSCTDVLNGFECKCIPGYSGIFCENDLAVCNKSIEAYCSNGGRCTEGPGLSFKCECVQGWEGKLCEKETDECMSSPCQNGAMCMDLHANYACACLFGYTGRNCESELKLCDMNLCQNEALCILEHETRVCYCVPDYHGARCQYKYDECKLGARCMNRGMCIDGIDTYTCSCIPGFTGSSCECYVNMYGIQECNNTVNQERTNLHQTTERTTIYETSLTNTHNTLATKKMINSNEFETSELTNSSTQINNTTELQLLNDTSTVQSNTYMTSTFPLEISSTSEKYVAQSKSDISTDQYEDKTIKLEKETTKPAHTLLHPMHSESDITTNQNKNESKMFTNDTTKPTYKLPVTKDLESNISTNQNKYETKMFTMDTTKPTHALSVPTHSESDISTNQNEYETKMFTTDSTKPAYKLSVTTDSEYNISTNHNRYETKMFTKEITKPTHALSVPTHSESNISTNQNEYETKMFTTDTTKPTYKLSVTTDSEYNISTNHNRYETKMFTKEITKPTHTLSVPTHLESDISTNQDEYETKMFTKETTKPTHKFTFSMQSESDISTNQNEYETKMFTKETTKPIHQFSVSMDSESDISTTNQNEYETTMFTKGTTKPSNKLADSTIFSQSTITNGITSSLVLNHTTILKKQTNSGLEKAETVTEKTVSTEITLEMPTEVYMERTTDYENLAESTTNNVKLDNTINSTMTLSSREEKELKLNAKSENYWPKSTKQKEVSVTAFKTETTSTEQDLITKIKPSTFDTSTEQTTTMSTNNTNITEQETFITTKVCNTCAESATPNEILTTITTTEETGITPFLKITPTISEENCSAVLCLNGGTCFIADKGPKCSCRFGWGGLLCEETIGIQVAAFTGKSYLMHYLQNQTSTVIALKIRTLSFTGLLFYAQVTADMYMCSYIQDDYLKFQFSCGMQTMVFSETKYRINTGYVTSIFATISILKKEWKLSDNNCTAALRINDTVVMSGEQTALGNQNILEVPVLYIGGMPKYLNQQLDLPVSAGITGCIHALQINGVERHIHRDAVDGLHVTECSSLLCLSSPCYNGGTCVEYEDTWNCLCLTGFTGHECNQSICRNNPCQYGATCIQYPISGFLCLCPYGKHGLFCEQELEITKARFSSSRHGYSSFAAYSIPTDAIAHNFEIKFKFIAETMEQIGLMLFVGQEGQHDVTSDHLAISFIKGYIALTWNLGAGPRRIFTPHPISKMEGKEHLIEVGRIGSKAWLFMDGFSNITGKSPGKFTQLNTSPIIYLGGHKSYQFQTLPHDLPLHNGFSGCLYDVELHTTEITLGLQQMHHPITGRSVAQCGTSECHNYTCQHEGACLQHGSTFTCLCTNGWFGPLCSYRNNLCDSSHHKCYSGSTCVLLTMDYECDCPLGKSGKYCEYDEHHLSDISFSGQRSYMSLLSPQDFSLKQFNIEFELRPFLDNGIILYTSQENITFFMSLYLQGRILELRTPVASNSQRLDDVDTMIIRSGKVLASNEWTKVRAGRFGQNFYLSINGVTNSGLLPTDTISMFNHVSIYFGGTEDLSTIKNDAAPVLPVPFNGCIRRLYINYKKIQLNKDNIKNARNIADCDGSPCNGDACQNGGTCWLNSTLHANCICTEEYKGKFCEHQVTCKEVACKNGGYCVTGNDNYPACHCSLGWIGPFCEKEMPTGPVMLSGNSYMIVDKQPVLHKRQSPVHIENITFTVYVKFSTTQKNGLILWSSQENEYIGIGIKDGRVNIALSYNFSGRNIETQNMTLDDGRWHTVHIHWVNSTFLIKVDNIEIYTQNYPIGNFIDTDGFYYIGGFPGNQNVQKETKSNFLNNFNGCIAELSWTEDFVIKSFEKYKAENVHSCFYSYN